MSRLMEEVKRQLSLDEMFGSGRAKPYHNSWPMTLAHGMISGKAQQAGIPALEKFDKKHGAIAKDLNKEIAPILSNRDHPMHKAMTSLGNHLAVGIGPGKGETYRVGHQLMVPLTHSQAFGELGREIVDHRSDANVGLLHLHSIATKVAMKHGLLK